MPEGLLIYSDGMVQVIGQPSTLTVFLPILHELTNKLEAQRSDERKQELLTLSTDELTEELERRRNSLTQVDE